MIFAERRRAESVRAKHFCQRRYIVRPDAGVAWKGRRKFHNGAGVVHVMVATGEQCRARGRTERSCLKGVVPEPICRQPVERGHVTGPAKCAGLSEADVV